MAKITIDIESCHECPFIKRERIYTGDSWEEAYDWFCTKVVNAKGENKKIQGYVEWRDKVKVPDWCPLETKQ